MPKTSQKQNILNHLLTGASLTCEQCREMGFGSNATQRIFNLTEDGHIIDSKEVKHENGYHSVYSISNAQIIKMIEEKAEMKIDDIYSLNKDGGNLVFVNGNIKLKDCSGLLFFVYNQLNSGFTACTF